MSADRLFIAAGNMRYAEEVARHLNLRPSQWRFLDDAYQLRGRPVIRIALGWRWREHRAAPDIEATLGSIKQARGEGAVELIEVPA